MPRPTIEYINGIWRVCCGGICREHRQDWQAVVFYHQMMAMDEPEPPNLSVDHLPPNA